MSAYTLKMPTFGEVEDLQRKSADAGTMADIVRMAVDLVVDFAAGHSLDAMPYDQAIELYRECQEYISPKARGGSSTDESPPEGGSGP